LPQGTIQRIAFGSCAFQWEEQTIWDAVVESDPDIFLFLGDAIYGDFDGQKAFDVTQESLAGEWQKLADRPEFQGLREKIPVMATWDNHDYGTHNGGAEFPLKEASRRIFLDFFGEPSDSVRRRTPGVYDAKIFGPPGRRVQIILLDTRYFKGPFVLRSKEEKSALGLSGSLGNYLPNTDPEVTLLGEEQWKWLEQQLQQPAEVRLIASSTQIVSDQKGMDEWGNYPLERRKLFDLIARTEAAGVVFLSGNVHFAELSKSDEGPYPLYDLTSSGLTHINEEYPQAVNPYRVAGPFVDLNFGLIEINWDANPQPLITFRAISVEGQVGFQQQISLENLRPKSVSER
jgi:alkaline phosphatase D